MLVKEKKSFTCALNSFAHYFPGLGFFKKIYFRIYLKLIKIKHFLVIEGGFAKSTTPIGFRSSVFQFKTTSGCGTYPSFNMTPHLDTSDPVCAVNIYGVTFYILLHKELSVP